MHNLSLKYNNVIGVHSQQIGVECCAVAISTAPLFNCIVYPRFAGKIHDIGTACLFGIMPEFAFTNTINAFALEHTWLGAYRIIGDHANVAA